MQSLVLGLPNCSQITAFLLAYLAAISREKQEVAAYETCFPSNFWQSPSLNH